MFNDCSNLNNSDASYFNTENEICIKVIFFECYINNFNVKNLKIICFIYYLFFNFK